MWVHNLTTSERQGRRFIGILENTEVVQRGKVVGRSWKYGRWRGRSPTRRRRGGDHYWRRTGTITFHEFFEEREQQLKVPLLKEGRVQEDERVDADSPAKSIKEGNPKTKLLKELSIVRDGPRSFPVFVESDPFWSRAWGVVNPRHVFVQMWDLNTLFLLVFTCLVTPYEIAFLDEVKGTGVEVLFYVNQLINIVFVVDMVLVFFLPLEGPNGSWITAKPALALSYFKRMFIIDAISVIPFDVIASQENKSSGSQGFPDL